MINYYEKKKGSTSTGLLAGFQERQERRSKMQEENIQFNDWVLHPDGTMVHTGPPYTIAGDQLMDPSWISQMKDKTWIDMNTFIDAYTFALIRAGVTQIEIKIY